MKMVRAERSQRDLPPSIETRVGRTPTELCEKFLCYEQMLDELY